MELVAALDVLMKLDKMVPEYSGNNSIAYKFEVAGGLDELEILQKHPNSKVYVAVE